MARSKTSSFAPVPFDGQEYIDAYRVKWQYDGDSKCWRRVGPVPEIPIATETQQGLLSAKMKELLDSIPEKGGHFGIIAKPLLGLIPKDIKTELEDTVFSATKNESGSVITGISPRQNKPYSANTYVGKFLRFTTGTLKDRTFLIYTNDNSTILVQGDASEAEYEDKFVVFDPLEVNEHGVVMGDVEIVSDTLDITCVDSSNNPMQFSQDCRLDYKDNDGGPQSPGLDFKVSDKILDSFCVELRQCKGPKGAKGPKGESGADGTGDGPEGEMGDPGQDAPTVSHKFSGIKFIESDDIYDSAVVGLELNAEDGKINVIKAKMVTPSDDTPATQLIANPIDRSLEWTDNEFGYNLLKPNDDPIEVSEEGDADITLGAYHKHFELVKDGLPEDIEKARIAQLSAVKLSELIDTAISYFRERLEDIEDDYNKEIKEFIENKDKAARAILASLAQQLAECEWQMPVEYCIGITPDYCGNGEPPGGIGGGEGGGGGGAGSGSGGSYSPTPTPWPHPIPRFPTPHSIPTPVPVGVPPDPTTTTVPSSGGSDPVITITEESPPLPSPTPAPPPQPQPPDPWVEQTYLVNIFGKSYMPPNAALAFTYDSGAVRTASSAWEVPVYAIGIVGTSTQVLSDRFHATGDYDPHDINSVEKAFRKGDPNIGLINDGRTFVVGDSTPIAKVYLVLRTKGPIVEGSIKMRVDVIYDANDPPSGVPVNVNSVVNTPGSNDPIVNSVNPNRINEGVPINISIYGKNFVDGATVNVQAPHAIAPAFTIATTTSTEITGEIFITPDVMYPPPEDLDVIVVNPDGSNGIGTGVITTI